MTLIEDQHDTGSDLGLRVGALVEVQNRFDGTWSGGFALEELVIEDLDHSAVCRLRRVSDGAVLPVALPRSRVRPRH